MKLLILSMLLCCTEVSAQEKITSELLLGCWVHAREESTEAYEVYRSCGYELPASRFRDHLDLKEEGACDWMYLAPNDAHHMKPGTWTFSEENNELVIDKGEGAALQHVEVVSVTEMHCI